MTNRVILDLKEVEAVLAGSIVTGIREKDRLEIINYEKVLAYIDKAAKKTRIDNWKKVILKIHLLTTRSILLRKECGSYRTGPVFVVQRPDNKIVYRAPTASKVSKLINDFCQWLSKIDIKELSPIIAAAISHHQLVTIHPFSDGNGRKEKDLTSWLVYFSRGFLSELEQVVQRVEHFSLEAKRFNFQKRQRSEHPLYPILAKQLNITIDKSRFCITMY